MPFLDGICSPTMLYIVILCVAIAAGSAIYYLHTLVCTCTERVNRLHQIIHIIHTERVGGAGTAGPVGPVGPATAAITGPANPGSSISIPPFNGRVLVSDSGDGDDEYSNGDYSDEDEEDDEYNSDNDYSDDDGNEDNDVLGTEDNADLLLAVRRDVTLEPVEEPDAVQVVVNKASPERITLDLLDEIDVEDIAAEEAIKEVEAEAVEEEAVEEAEKPSRRVTQGEKTKMSVVQLRSRMEPDFPHEKLSKMSKTQLLQLFKTKYPDS